MKLQNKPTQLRLDFCWYLMILAIRTAPKNLTLAEKQDYIDMLTMGDEL